MTAGGKENGRFSFRPERGEENFLKKVAKTVAQKRLGRRKVAENPVTQNFQLILGFFWGFLKGSWGNLKKVLRKWIEN